MSNPSLKLSQFDVEAPLASDEVKSYPVDVEVISGDLYATDHLNQTTNLGQFKGVMQNHVSDGSVTEYGSVIINEFEGAAHEYFNVVYDRRETYKLEGTGLKSEVITSSTPYDFMFPAPPDTVSATQTVVTFTDGTVFQTSALWSGLYFASNLLNRTVLNNGDGVVFYGYSYPQPGARWCRYTFPERRWIAGVRLCNLRTDYGINTGYIRTSNDGINWTTAVSFSLPAVSSGARNFMFAVVKPVKYVELRVTSEYSRGAALGQFDILEAIDTEVVVKHKKLQFDVNKLTVDEQPDGIYLGIRTSAGGGGSDALTRSVSKYSRFMVDLPALWGNSAGDYPRMLPLTTCRVNNLGLKKYGRGLILPKGSYVATIRTSFQGGGPTAAYLADMRNNLPLHGKLGAYNSASITSSGGHDHQVYFTVAEDTPIQLQLSPNAGTSQMVDVDLDGRRRVASLEIWKVSDDVVRQYVSKRTFKPAAAGDEADFVLIRGVVGNGASPHNQLNGEGLFNLPYGGSLSAVQDFRIATACVYLRVNHDFKLWKYPVANTAATSGKLRIEKIDGVWTDYTQQSLMVTANADWVPFTEILPPGTYRISYAGAVRTDYQWYVEKCVEGSGRVFKRGDRVNLIEPMYSNDTETQTISASSQYDANYPAWKLTQYEGYTLTDCWAAVAAVVSDAAPQWVSITYKNGPVEINGYEMANRYTSTSAPPATWQLQGRNASEDEWVDIHSVVGDYRADNRENRTFYLNEPVSYSQYRLYITDKVNNIATYTVVFASFRLFYEIYPE